MNVTLNKLPKNQVELTIELTQEELKSHIQQAVAEISKEITIAGFRPGKAPYEIVEKQVGAIKIYQQAAEKAIQKTYPQAIIENKLLTVGPPKIAVEKIAPNNPFVYKATASLLPSVKLGDYKKIKEGRREVKVEAKEIDGTLQNLRKMFGKEKRVSRSVQKGDKVEIDMNTYVDKVPIDGGKSENHPITVGEGHFIPGFEDNLIGLIEGQTKEFQLKFPKEYHQKNLAGKPVDFKVKVKSVFEIEKPDLDDNFAKTAGKFEKLDDLRRQIEKNIHQEKTTKEQQRWELAVIEQIINKSSFDEIPDVLIESELHKMLHELEHEVTGQGMKFEDYLSSIKKSKEDLQKEFQPRAVKRVKTAFVIRKIAKEENITVSDEEIDKEVERNKQQYQNNPEVLKQISRDEYKNYLKSVLRSQKVFEFLAQQN
jgi:trigger factor